jgi:hypothetical protein
MMMMVGFKVEGAHRDAFLEELKSLGNWSNRIDDAWLLETPLSPRRVRDLLKEKTQPGDRVFVARISRNWAGFAMGEGFPEWLGRREFGTFTPEG